ncbi:hypothetical protein [Peribacillus sp. SCS-155]|uniref:hypothetical protein n=1 Tax=Peribacillus sedimenti TaxID=3115297 RepID=UPI003906C6A2
MLGTDDYTKRLHLHVDKIANEQEIGFPDLKAKISFVSSDEAAEALYFLLEQPGTGPINVCSDGSMELQELVGLIEKATNKKAKLASEINEQNQSPFGLSASWYMSNEKAKAAGFQVQKLDYWLPLLIGQLAVKE